MILLVICQRDGIYDGVSLCDRGGVRPDGAVRDNQFFLSVAAADDVAALFSSFIWVFSDFLFFNLTEIEIFLLLFFIDQNYEKVAM